jgi:hypothetical protein
MTVPVLDASTQYTGTGSRVFFEYGFDINEDTGVYVLVDYLDAAYTLQATGIVFDVAPAQGALILIYRITDLTQLRDFQPFESFPADKTESALDKLIYLKGEAIVFRAFCNLLAIHALDRVTIDNDKGTNAEIFIWNLNKAGVFAGEVTDDMPNAGTFVEKPWDFVYFQYGVPVPQEFTYYTTTPYPIEVIEEMQFGIDVSGGSLSLVPEDDAETAILLDYGPDEDDVDYGHTLTSIVLTEILLDYGPDEDDADYGHTLTSVTLTNKLVEADTPDEELDLGCDIKPSACSMTHI